MLRFNLVETEESKYRRFIRIDLGFLILVFLSVLAVVYYQYQGLGNKVQFLNIKISNLNREITRLKGLKSTEKELLKLKSNLQHKLDIVSSLEKNRHVPTFLYFFENRKIMNKIWLDRLKYNGNKLNLEANALNIKDIPPFLNNLDRELGVVKLWDIERKEYQNRNLNYRVNYYKFKLNVRLSNGLHN